MIPINFGLAATGQGEGSQKHGPWLGLGHAAVALGPSDLSQGQLEPLRSPGQHLGPFLAQATRAEKAEVSLHTSPLHA